MARKKIHWSDSKRKKRLSTYAKVVGNPEMVNRGVDWYLYRLDNKMYVSEGQKRYYESELRSLGYGDKPNIWEGSPMEIRSYK